MAVAAVNARSLTALARLGRVSNLPTVWTNVLAATVLAGGDWQNLRTAIVLVAMSLFYVGGMYLNDYFDRAIDARERPTRPIPAGDVSAGMVAAIGFALLGGGIAVMAPLGGAALAGRPRARAGDRRLRRLAQGQPGRARRDGAVPRARLCGRGGRRRRRCAVDRGGGGAGDARLRGGHHLRGAAGKLRPHRQSVAARGAGGPGGRGAGDCAETARWRSRAVSLLAAWTAAAVHLLIRRPVAGAVSRAVSWLIAGISLVDAAFLAGAGAVAAAALAILGCAATLAAQRYVAGT